MAINFLQTTIFDDNVKLQLGNGNDLQIYHDGSNSFIDNSTGNLTIDSGTHLLLKTATGESLANFLANGANELFYDNVKKFETTNAGVSITGSGTFSGSITVGSTGADPLLFSKSTYGDMDTDAFYRIKFQDQGGVLNDVGIGQTATGNLGFNITAGKDFLFNGGTSGNALTLTAGGNATFAGTVTLGSVPTIATTASIFLTTSSGVISSRTAAQVRSDIGAGTSSTTGTVTSVGLSHTGNAFSVGSSPVTSSGTIAVDVVGSGSQYITGDGNLETFPTTITSGQASAITANTAKVGITSTQASDITANNAKATDTGTPAILSNGITPSLNTNISALEVRTLIGAGTSSSSGTVTSVSGTTPIASTGGATPAISIATANASTTGALTSTDWNTFNSKTTNTGTATSVGLSADGDALQVTGTPVTTSGTLALSFQGETGEYINGEGDLTTFPTIPSAANNATVTISAGTGLTGGGSFTVNQSGNSTITLNASGSGTVTSVTGTSPIVSSGGTTPAISINTNLITTLSGLTSTGRITSGTWSANTQLNVSAATDYSFQGERVFFGSGTVVEGRVYNFSSGGSWVLADADSESTSNGLLAIATGNGTASSVGMFTRGMYTLSTDPGTIGNSLFLSSTAGSLEDGAPTASGRVVRIVGTVLDSTNGQIFFHPDNTFITLS